MHSTYRESRIAIQDAVFRERMPLWKRSLDIACCLLALPLFLVVAAVMLIVTRLTAPGPVFFKQQRVGHHGVPFMCYKFRTMVVGAETSSHQAYTRELIHTNAPMVKLDAKRDTRLIPGGWIVRASGLDELPQIINVLRGEMSIVGPRPCVPYEYEQYSDDQKRRFQSWPGLTGLWQVSGKNRTTFDEMIRLDIRYSEVRSFWLDVRIIVMTVPALLTQISDTRSGRKSAMETKAPFAAPRPVGSHSR